MRLAEVAEIGEYGKFGTIEVTGISADSRKIARGDIFVAVHGAKADGIRFAADAEAKGAAAILCERGHVPESISIPVVEVDDPRRSLALIAAQFFPRQPETIVAVTGTSGKTSVAAFARQIWAHCGFAAASIGTTGLVAPNFEEYGSLTTPDPVALHKMLARLASEGVDHAAMEASSHGLDQRRLDGVRLAAAGFTNLGRDHLDYHPSMEDYHRAKMRLFEKLLPSGKPAIVFADDAWSQATCEIIRAAGRELHTVGRKGDFLKLKRVEHERSRQRAEIEADGKIAEIFLPLAGDFQIANALVAAGLAIATGVPADQALAALEHLKGAPGRLDLVGATPAGAPVYVDYAHKPEALENVLAAVRPFTTGRVIVVFGCGGDRDKGKRPIMGEIASRLADVVIITDDNPRSEEPDDIRRQIMEAAPGAIEIGDRRAAIAAGIAELRAGDTLVVAGKGHEEGQTIGDTTLPFSDHAVVREMLAGLAA
jgi:UDP-N-acetylmuramoyl-L-alanyl-D-glutamate--2,6-diaminopimelate ligase